MHRRIQVTLAGGTMGTGVATHYWGASTAGFQPAVKAFWTSVAAIMSGYVTITVPNSGDEFDETTGTLTGAWSEGTAATITGGGTGAYAGGVGACIAWKTAFVHGGRRVQGRTFVVPLALNQYDADGTLAAGCVTALQSAASTLISSSGGKLVVWARPQEPSLKHPSGLTGADGIITSGVVKDHVSWLRSRR